MGAGGVGIDGGHPAAHRLHRFGVELGLLPPQGVGHTGQVGVQHDAPVVEQPPPAGVLGVAGELHPVDGQVVAAGERRVDAEAGQGPDHRLHKDFEVEAGGVGLVHDEGEIQIALVVVYRPAAGQPPGHTDSVGVHIGLVDLLGGVLIFAHHDGVVILPEHEVGLAFVHPLKDILLQGQVKVGIPGRGFQIEHALLSSRPGFSPDGPSGLYISGGAHLLRRRSTPGRLPAASIIIVNRKKQPVNREWASAGTTCTTAGRAASAAGTPGRTAAGPGRRTGR